jgi:hypothetical protein
VTIQASISGQVAGVLQVSLTGAADPSGGVTLRTSTAAIGPPTDASLYQGRVTSLNGDQLELSLRNPDGATLTVTMQVRVDSTGSVTGSVAATS